MRIICFEATPYNPATSTFTTVRMVTANAATNVFDGLTWVPCIREVPSINISVFADGEPKPANVGYGSLGFTIKSDLGNQSYSTLVWDGALARMWVGDDAQPFATFTKLFEGSVGSLSRTYSGASIPLLGPTIGNRPLLTSTYAGTGGAAGPSSIKGQFKPVSFGYCENVEPVLVDPIYNIYQVHDGAINGIVKLYEFAREITATPTVVSTWAELQALTLTAGQWAQAPAIGCFRIGAPATKVLTVDVEGALDGATYVSTLSGIVPLLLKRAGILSGQIASGPLAGFNKAWSYHTSTQVETFDVIRDAMSHQAGYILPDADGVWQAGVWLSTKTPVTLSGDRTSLPHVVDVKQLAADAPSYGVRVGYGRSWRVHSPDEISPVIADIQGDVVAAQDAAAAAALAAADAQADADASQTELNNILADSILDRSEKANLVQRFAELTAEKTGLNNEATNLGATSENTAYNAAYTALQSYLNGLTPAWDNLTVSTPVTRATFDANWTALNTAKVALTNKLANIAATKAIWETVTGPNRPADNATVGADLLTNVTNRSLVNLDASAAALLNFSSGTFVNFSASYSTFVTASYGGGVKSGSTGANASAWSAPMPDGVIFQGRFGNNTSKIQTLVLTTNPSAVAAYGAGDYGFYLEGANLRTVKNGSTFVIDSIKATEQLTIAYDQKTGVISYYRGNLLIDTATVSTGITYNVAWRPNTNGVELTNATIWPYSADGVKIATVEAGANPTVGEGTLNRNSFFELVDSTGALSAWRFQTGSTNTRVIDSDARKGQYMMNITGGTMNMFGETFPVKPLQALWFHPRVKLLRGNDGTTSGTMRLWMTIQYSDTPEFTTNAYIGHSQLNDGTKAANTTYETVDRVVIPATFSGSLIPKYARVYARFIMAAPLLGQARIDFVDVRDTQSGATLGAQSGTNIFRTDGTTVLTQAELRTAEGTAAFLAGSGSGAYANTLIQLNSTDGTKLAGIETAADVTSYNSGQTAVTIAADYTGTVLTGQLPKTIGYTRTHGVTNVTTSATWTVAVIAGTATGTIGSATGVLTLSTLGSTSAVIDVTSTYNGVARTIRLTVTRADASAPVDTGGSGSGGTVSGALSGPIANTSYSGAYSPTITLECGASGTVNLAAAIEYQRASTASGSSTGHGKWQWRTIGGSYADVAAEVNGTSATTVNEYGEPEQNVGSINVNQTKTGLTSGVSYEFILLMRRSGGSAIDAYGTYSATSS